VLADLRIGTLLLQHLDDHGCGSKFVPANCWSRPHHHGWAGLQDHQPRWWAAFSCPFPRLLDAYRINNGGRLESGDPLAKTGAGLTRGLAKKKREFQPGPKPLSCPHR